MIRQLFNKKNRISPRGFRYRGLATSRLENLTDAVFAFAITLLVISSEVPRTYVELQASMYGFIGFIFCIMLLLGIWNNHSNFFKHYGMQDTATKYLNFLFLFLLLFYIYPLKYLFSYLGTAIYIQIKLALGDQSEALILSAKKLNEASLDNSQWADIMIRFGLGLFFIYFILMLFHVNALKKRKILSLNELEIFDTKSFIQAYGILVGVTVVSMLIVLIFGGELAALAGATYATIPFLLGFQRRYRNRNYNLIKNHEVPEKFDAEVAIAEGFEHYIKEAELEKRKTDYKAPDPAAPD